jgi:hypothetical protein
MLKEIMEQPESVHNSMRGRILSSKGTTKLGGIELHENIFERLLMPKDLLSQPAVLPGMQDLSENICLNSISGFPLK